MDKRPWDAGRGSGCRAGRGHGRGAPGRGAVRACRGTCFARERPTGRLCSGSTAATCLDFAERASRGRRRQRPRGGAIALDDLCHRRGTAPAGADPPSRSAVARGEPRRRSGIARHRLVTPPSSTKCRRKIVRWPTRPRRGAAAGRRRCRDVAAARGRSCSHTSRAYPREAGPSRRRLLAVLAVDADDIGVVPCTTMASDVRRASDPGDALVSTRPSRPCADHIRRRVRCRRPRRAALPRRSARSASRAAVRDSAASSLSATFGRECTDLDLRHGALSLPHELPEIRGKYARTWGRQGTPYPASLV